MDKLVGIVRENVEASLMLPDGVANRSYLDALYWVLSVVDGLEVTEK